MNKIIILLCLLILIIILIIILFTTKDKFTPGPQQLLSLTGSGKISPEPLQFLADIRDAYENPTGTGVLISEATFYDDNLISIDGSGSIVKKDFYNRLYDINSKTDYFSGYIWHPKDNLNTIQCTYTADAVTAERDEGRCSYAGAQQYYPIMCTNTKLDPPRSPQETRCEVGDNCFDNDEKATSTGLCPANRRCPKSLCGPNQNCISCMLSQSKTIQNSYSNFSPLYPKLCPECDFNEVVFAENLEGSNTPLSWVQKNVFQKEGRPGPSALVIGIPFEQTYNGPGTPCELILQDETAAVFDRLKKHFVQETVVVLIRCNNNNDRSPAGYQEIKFVDAFQLKDIDTKICKKQ